VQVCPGSDRSTCRTCAFPSTVSCGDDDENGGDSWDVHLSKAIVRIRLSPQSGPGSAEYPRIRA
jgi:hypothetical protein